MKPIEKLCWEGGSQQQCREKALYAGLKKLQFSSSAPLCIQQDNSQVTLPPPKRGKQSRSRQVRKRPPEKCFAALAKVFRFPPAILSSSRRVLQPRSESLAYYHSALGVKALLDLSSGHTSIHIIFFCFYREGSTRRQSALAHSTQGKINGEGKSLASISTLLVSWYIDGDYIPKLTRVPSWMACAFSRALYILGIVKPLSTPSFVQSQMQSCNALYVCLS